MLLQEQHANIVSIDEKQTFEQTVLHSSVPVLVDFWAPWCGPCRVQAPILEEFADEAGDRVRVVKVNVDNHGDLAQRYRIAGIPTMILFDDGQEAKRMVGLHSLDRLKKAASL